MSRYLMQRIVPLFRNRVRQNQMLLSTSSSVNASRRPDEDSSTGIDGDPYSINMSDSCIRRMKELHAKETSGEGKMLRLSVEAGGCSGFQYVFKLDGKANPDDRIFEKEGVKLVVDNISYDFVRGATVDYVEELIRAAFLVTQNPSAVGGCSCKSSFMVK